MLSFKLDKRQEGKGKNNHVLVRTNVPSLEQFKLTFSNYKTTNKARMINNHLVNKAQLHQLKTGPEQKLTDGPEGVKFYSSPSCHAKFTSKESDISPKVHGRRY